KASEPAPVPAPSAEAGLVGRGRQKRGPGPFTEEGKGKNLIRIYISAGFQQMKLGERGGRRRDFHDTGINTRQVMEHVKDSKTGSSGAVINLTANYSRILSRPEWVLFQYHVDFKPVMDSRRLRSALLFQHEEVLGPARSFDGALLFLPHRLHNKETVVCSQTRNGENVQITITLTNELPPTSPVCIQFYNIIFRRILRILNMQQIGRNYYNPDDPLEISQHSLTIWPGYATTILRYESSIMMCMDVSHKVLRSETVLSFMANLERKCQGQNYHEMCEKELVGLIVLTKYNNKTYRIDGIAWDHTPINTFKKGSADISFKDYYKNVNVLKSTKGIFVFKGLTDKMRKDFTIMKDLSAHTRLNPDQREKRLTSFLSNIQRNAEAQTEMTKWGLSFDKQLLKLTGRVLGGERLFQGSQWYDYNPQTADWSREMRGLSVISSPPLNCWLLFHTKRNSSEAQSLLQSLNKVSAPLGIRMQRATVVVILPNNNKDRYDTVKKYLCLDCPTPSQCVVGRTLSRPQALMTVATKIVLQMACKMGGELWSVEIPVSTRAVDPNLLVCGKWYSKCVLQHQGQEIMDGLKTALSGALKDYHKFNNCLPARIIVYRDGVGDGQLQSVVNYEVSQIMDCIRSMEQDYKPKLSVVVVKKRISSRFFTYFQDRLTNPPPGTVIDTEVTRPEWYDFYIVSQAVRSGSVSPTHYNVVYDTSGLKPDHMQRLTYKLCHMYYNWQGIIRVPAPCQYAHKLAFLVGQSIHKQPNAQLDDFLFYL
uniref:Piwi-like RNA-mediated gene silencing 1 n=1 Tax=Nothobranchius furzeri TaxID=105023 RepID=A0A8C6Q6P4_NOTFU